MTTGETLKALRERAGLAQEQLAVAAGVSGRTVSLIETGRLRPHRATLAALAIKLGVSVDTLRADGQKLAFLTTWHTTSSASRPSTKRPLGANPVDQQPCGAKENTMFIIWRPATNEFWGGVTADGDWVWVRNTRDAVAYWNNERASEQVHNVADRMRGKRIAVQVLKLNDDGTTSPI